MTICTILVPEGCGRAIVRRERGAGTYLYRVWFTGHRGAPDETSASFLTLGEACESAIDCLQGVQP